MDRLSEMEAFAAVVDHGGFTEAGRKLGLSKSAISKQVAALEDRLGARLLNRTTRHVSPTEIGQAYYARARDVIDRAAQADELAAAMQATPRGELRISAPVSFGLAHLSPILADFLAKFPEITLNTTLDDRFVDLIGGGYDMALRIGQLPDSSLMARKLAETRLTIVASPAYLAANGTPQSPDDLAHHSLLHYVNVSSGPFWRLKDARGEERLIRVSGPMIANNGDVLQHAALSGAGLAMQPSFISGPALRTGALVEVLTDLPPVLLGIYAVYPEGRFTQPKLRALIDHLAAALKGRGAEDW